MDNTKIGLFLQGLRKEKNLTQQQLAQVFNVTHQSVSKWEKGDSLPDVTLLRELAQYYDISIEEILNGEKNALEEKKVKTNNGLMYYNIAYLVILVCLLGSLGFFYIHEEVSMNFGNQLFGVDGMNQFFDYGYVTLNIRGFNIIFNATKLTLFSISLWLLFLSTLTLITQKILNIICLKKRDMEHPFSAFKIVYNFDTIMELVIVLCFTLFAIAILLENTVRSGIGYYVGIVFLAGIFVVRSRKKAVYGEASE